MTQYNHLQAILNPILKTLSGVGELDMKLFFSNLNSIVDAIEAIT